MGVYTNAELDKKYPPAKIRQDFPIVTDTELDRVKATWTEDFRRSVYESIKEGGASFDEVARSNKITVADAKDAYEGYKKVRGLGYSREPIVFVPAWNDIIHLVDEKKLPVEEQRRRMVRRIETMARSPAPEVARHIGTIATAIDDVQDFTTTIGVGARLIEKSLKLPHIMSKGVFTSGELLNSLNMHNKIPYEKLAPKDLMKLVDGKKIDLDLLTPDQLTSIRRAMEKAYPDWAKIPKDIQAKYIQKNYKITRERWGMTLKEKKRLAEMNYSKGTRWGKIKAQVDKRLKRLAPSQGEMMEIAQTSDMIAGVGLSLGPIVGFLIDRTIGIQTGAKMKYSPQEISDEELAVITRFGKFIISMGRTEQELLAKAARAIVKPIYMLAVGEDLELDLKLKALWTATQGAIITRSKEVARATTSLWEMGPKRLYNPGPRTSWDVLNALLEARIDPRRDEAWPGIELPRETTLQEIASAYLPKIQQQITLLQQETNGTVEGEFVSACLHAIAQCTACFWCEEGGVIEESFSKELYIYTRAIDYGLEPPIYSTDEEFSKWHAYISDYMTYEGSEEPRYELLLRAIQKYFPEEADLR